MSSISLSGYVYYVSFIDDFSCKTWIYFLKGKNEEFNKFKEYKSLSRNQIERNIKTLRSDNGGEFTSKYFKELCWEYRINMELSTPYNPQQNNVAKWKNMTITEAVKAMLHDQDILMHLWEEPTRKFVYVQNCTPHLVLDKKTLEEDFSKEKP